MQDALMQATFLMTTQRIASVTFLSLMNQMYNALISGAIQVYHCGVLKMQLFKLWHIFPKGKQEIKKYYAVSVVCHKKELWKNVSLKKKKSWENSFYFPNNCKYTIHRKIAFTTHSPHTKTIRDHFRRPALSWRPSWPRGGPPPPPRRSSSWGCPPSPWRPSPSASLQSRPVRI